MLGRTSAAKQTHDADISPANNRHRREELRGSSADRESFHLVFREGRDGRRGGGRGEAEAQSDLDRHRCARLDRQRRPERPPRGETTVNDLPIVF